jgi:hypothetical protein
MIELFIDVPIELQALLLFGLLVIIREVLRWYKIK